MELIMNAKAFRHKVISYGPGGYHCPCCGPAPKKRKQERRYARKVEARILDLIERVEAADEGKQQ